MTPDEAIALSFAPLADLPRPGLTARLQAATSSKRPVLLWTSAESGHQISSSEALQQRADTYAFIFAEMGIEYREPR